MIYISDAVVINFISTFKHYDAEASGIKPYTIRELTFKLKKKIVLGNKPTHVRIRRGYTQTCFTRKITHTLEWDKYIIFAWNPNEVNKE